MDLPFIVVPGVGKETVSKNDPQAFRPVCYSLQETAPDQHFIACAKLVQKPLLPLVYRDIYRDSRLGSNLDFSMWVKSLERLNPTPANQDQISSTSARFYHSPVSTAPFLEILYKI